MSSGQATFTTTLLPSGTRSLKALYNGNASLAPSLSTTLSLSLNSLPGNGFQPVLTTSIGTNPIGLVLADFNGDGQTDVAYPVESCCGAGIMLGKGDGTFLPVSYSPAGTNPFKIASADFNGDGKPDIVVINFEGGASVLLGKGDGTFQPPVNFATGPTPWSVAVGDFNRDGKADLAIACDGSVSILLGNGDGSFQPSVGYPAGRELISIALGDFNGDGEADIAVGGSSGTLNIFLGNGDGTFAGAVNYSAGAGILQDIAVGDINGDGNADLAVASETPSSPGTGAMLAVLIGNGDGTFQPVTLYTPGDSYSVALGDFDGDGKPDLAITNKETANNSRPVLDILHGNGDGTFQPAVAYPTGIIALKAAVGDFNGDGRADIIDIDNSGHLNILLGAIPEPSVLCPAATAPILTNNTYTLNCAASGGVSPYTWSITTGTLPTGLTLNTTTGTIAGMPAAAGSFSFTINATDSDTPPQTATQNVTLTIGTQLKLTASPLPSGTAGSAYTLTLATGGTSPYTCSVSAGTLPAGMMLTSATCALSGPRRQPQPITSPSLRRTRARLLRKRLRRPIP